MENAKLTIPLDLLFGKIPNCPIVEFPADDAVKLMIKHYPKRFEELLKSTLTKEYEK